MALKLKHGDKIYLDDNHGNIIKGTVVMPSPFKGGYVVNIGGRYGTPFIVGERNFVGFQKKMRKVI